MNKEESHMISQERITHTFDMLSIPPKSVLFSLVFFVCFIL